MRAGKCTKVLQEVTREQLASCSSRPPLVSSDAPHNDKCTVQHSQPPDRLGVPACNRTPPFWLLEISVTPPHSRAARATRSSPPLFVRVGAGGRARRVPKRGCGGAPAADPALKINQPRASVPSVENDQNACDTENRLSAQAISGKSSNGGGDQRGKTRSSTGEPDRPNANVAKQSNAGREQGRHHEGDDDVPIQ